VATHQEYPSTTPKSIVTGSSTHSLARPVIPPAHTHHRRGSDKRGKTRKASGRGSRRKRRRGRGGREGGRRTEKNVRFFINPDPPVKASPAARIELTLGMYILLCVYVLKVIR